MYFFIHLLVEETPSVSSEERSGFDIGAGMAQDCFNDNKEINPTTCGNYSSRFYNRMGLPVKSLRNNSFFLLPNIVLYKYQFEEFPYFPRLFFISLH